MVLWMKNLWFCLSLSIDLWMLFKHHFLRIHQEMWVFFYISIVQNASPVHERLRNYSQLWREFSKASMCSSVENIMEYFNSTSCSACAPLLISNSAANLIHKVDLRPVYRYTIIHPFPMHMRKQDLLSVSESKYFARLELSYCYWRLPLESHFRNDSFSLRLIDYVLHRGYCTVQQMPLGFYKQRFLSVYQKTPVVKISGGLLIFWFF